MSICVNCDKYKNNEHCNDSIEFCEYQLAEHDKKIKAQTIEEIYNRLDEGVCCDECEYQDFDAGCFKTCDFEMENAKKWLLKLKDQNM